MILTTLINGFCCYIPGSSGAPAWFSDSKTRDTDGNASFLGEKGETATWGENATVGHRKNLVLMVDIAKEGRSHIGDTGHTCDGSSHAPGCPKSSSTGSDGEKHSLEGTEEVPAEYLLRTD